MPNLHGCSKEGMSSSIFFSLGALYQLHLVKAETARAFIPKDFRLVEAFGYTLGGFFLAHYDDSPAGMFDELVVIAGIVWNPPTSCAWAARVLVNNHEACIHGRKDIGLPSQVAGFSKSIMELSERPRSKGNGFLDRIGIGAGFSSPKDRMKIQVTEIKDSAATDFCNINLPTLQDPKSGDKWMGPAVKMSLPSFSGQTEYNPQLLKYSCQIECRVRAVEPAQVSKAAPAQRRDEKSAVSQNSSSVDAMIGDNDDARDRSISVLLSKPVLALEFNFLKMQVEAPTVVSCSSSRKNSRGGF
ncbi:hypothetical protein BVC80_8933g18 [Macleaya cordata]|uniref:Protein NEOXANTHIN-DEFICIENT 1 n=1 Tax=Macleaya cordata TaxID=56857 RepID=A0A200R8E1_MACCD|nr:hypothetical protein BVC80_8933g18 [Macleaya cordata]